MAQLALGSSALTHVRPGGARFLKLLTAVMGVWSVSWLVP